MSDHQLQWFPCYPSKLLGALSGMKPSEGYIYWIVCLRIYETGRACRDTVDVLARRSGLSRRRVSEALELSFMAGRLVKDGDGIVNPFAAKVLTEANLLRQKRSNASKKAVNQRWEKTQRKQREDDTNRNADAMRSDTHLHLQKKKKESKKILSMPISEWVPSADCRKFAANEGWQNSRIDSEAARFRNHAMANGKNYKNIDAAWRNWVTSPYQKNGNGNGAASQRKSSNGAASLLLKMMEAENGDEEFTGTTLDHDGIVPPDAKH